jgi:hypothetical protein
MTGAYGRDWSVFRSLQGEHGVGVAGWHSILELGTAIECEFSLRALCCLPITTIQFYVSSSKLP